jgi:hypothetical protein
MRDICGKNHKQGLKFYDECVKQKYGYLFMNFNLPDNYKYHNGIDY